jgi:hypothetical protein
VSGASAAVTKAYRVGHSSAGCGGGPIVADGADGILEIRVHSDDPTPSAALTTKGNRDAQGPQNALSAPQPAGQRAGILRPAAASAQSAVSGKIGPSPQQVGGNAS